MVDASAAALVPNVARGLYVHATGSCVRKAVSRELPLTPITRPTNWYKVPHNERHSGSGPGDSPRRSRRG